MSTKTNGSTASTNKALKKIEAYAIAALAGGGSGGGGAVGSVNGQTGTVVLTQDNVADGTTNKAFTATEKTKLSGIAPGATANIGDVTLANTQAFTGYKSFTNNGTFPAGIDGTGSASYFKINNTAGANNVGFQLQHNNVEKWTINSTNGKFNIFNSVIAQPSIAIDDSDNTVHIYGQVDSFAAYNITHNYGTKSIYKNSANSADAVIIDGSTSSIQLKDTATGVMTKVVVTNGLLVLSPA